MLLTTVSYSGAVSVLCVWLSARVCAEEVGGSSLCSLKGKYKARTKLGAQAGKTAGKAREGKVVGIC